jgi:YVTN family beta-propeller protein
MTAYAYATSEDAASVTVIDLDSRRAVAMLPAGAGAHSLTITPDGRRLYVANRRYRTVTVIDPVEVSVARTIELPSSPSGIAASPDGRLLAVLGRTDLIAWVIEAESGAVLREPALGSLPEDRSSSGDEAPFSTHPVWAADGHSFYAEDNVNARLVRVDAESGAVTRTTPLPSPAHMVYLDSARGRIYALCTGDPAAGSPAAVAVVDAESGALQATLPVPLAGGESGELHHGCFDAGGDRFFVANMGTGRPRGGHSVHILDTGTLTFTGRLEARAGAGHPLLSPDGTRLFVVNHAAPFVSVFDVTTLRLLGEVELAGVRSMGHGCLFSEDGRDFWAVSNSGGAAYAIDVRTLKVVSRVPTGAGTQEIARTWSDAFS